jgi:serine/threonine protein kinase
MTDHMALNTGDLFAQRYVIERALGEGDRKKTYLARDRKMDRDVALSFVKPEAMLQDPEGTEREAKVLGRIGIHDNIVSLFDYEIAPDGSAQYMVFEYLRGGTLAGYLKARGALPPGQLFRLGRQLCRGLAHLHNAGLIHRDISPENIWLDERYVAHLGDFDSAVMVSGGDGGGLPITTGRFASPEELAGQQLDIRSDLYSLGGVLHVAATGEAYPGDRSLMALQTDLPTSFAELLELMLAELPADRPANAGDVLESLRAVERASDVEGLIAGGESEKMEFKSSLHHPHGEMSQEKRKKIEAGVLTPTQAIQEVQRELRKSVTKTVAAFLNASGGTLIIGVSDSGAALGIEHDYKYLEASKRTADGWLLSLGELVQNALGKDVWGLLTVPLVQYKGVLVAVVQVPACTTETWHRGDRDQQHFFVRSANSTTELTGPSLLRYAREHFSG